MENISKNLIIMSIFALIFGYFFEIPTANAFYSCERYPNYRYCDGKEDNPEPGINSISPSSVEKVTDKITVTVRGNNFIPSSIVKKNGVNSPTVYIDDRTLMVDIYASEARSKSEIFLTVYNGEPVGGYSRAVTFTIKSNIPVTSNETNKEPKKTIDEKIISAFTQEKDATKTSSSTNKDATDINEDYGKNGLVATALIGGESFMPSGFAQWIIFIFALILIVVLWRYINHSKEAYMAEPMKHA